jgi:hypothetical protein
MSSGWPAIVRVVDRVANVGLASTLNIVVPPAPLAGAEIQSTGFVSVHWRPQGELTEKLPMPPLGVKLVVWLLTEGTHVPPFPGWTVNPPLEVLSGSDGSGSFVLDWPVEVVPT